MRASDPRGETAGESGMITRRSMLKISIAAAAATAVAGYRARQHLWQGYGFGAALSVTLKGEEDAANTAFSAIEAEIEHLENVFSLYRKTSAISRLNQQGSLAAPPAALTELLTQSRLVWQATGGAFDPTVQALWSADAGGENAGRATGFEHVEITADRIAFARPDMAITLNGIAQGYASMRIAALLRARGFDAHLVDMGEFTAGDARWRLALENIDGVRIDQIPLQNRAQATSAPGAMQRPAGGSHIMHPQGRLPRWKTISVQAETAVMADGFSTALALMSAHEIAALDKVAYGLHHIWLEDEVGAVTVI